MARAVVGVESTVNPRRILSGHVLQEVLACTCFATGRRDEAERARARARERARALARERESEEAQRQGRYVWQWLMEQSISASTSGVTVRPCRHVINLALDCCQRAGNPCACSSQFLRRINACTDHPHRSAKYERAAPVCW